MCLVMINQSQRAKILVAATLFFIVVAARFSGSWSTPSKDSSIGTPKQIQNPPGPSISQISSPDTVESAKSPQRFLRQYLIYSPRAVSDAFARGQIVVLYFYSNASSDSKKADADLQKNFQTLPFNITILKVSFDRDRALKKRYGITAPDTFLQINRQGAEVTKWLSGGDPITTLSTNILR